MPKPIVGKPEKRDQIFKEKEKNQWGNYSNNSLERSDIIPESNKFLHNKS